MARGTMWRCVAGMAAGVAMATAAGADEGAQVARVAKDGAVLRAGGSQMHPELGSLKADRLVIVWTERNDWVQVELPPEIRVWISARYVKQEGDSGEVTASRVYLRPGPSTQEAPLGTVERGERLQVVGAEDGWLQVMPTKVARGWIQRSLLSDFHPGTEAEFTKIRLSGSTTGSGITPIASVAAPALPLEPTALLGSARAAVADALEGTVGQRDFARAKEILAQLVGTSGPMADDVKSLVEAVTAGEREDVEKRDRQAKAAANLTAIEARYKKTIAEIQRELDKIKNEKPVVEPFAAVGDFSALGLLVNRPGTHTITTAEGARFILRSASLNLFQGKFFGRRVGVRGQVVEIPGWGRVIEVHELEVLGRTGK